MSGYDGYFEFEDEAKFKVGDKVVYKYENLIGVVKDVYTTAEDEEIRYLIRFEDGMHRIYAESYLWLYEPEKKTPPLIKFDFRKEIDFLLEYAEIDFELLAGSKRD